jgi:hypothetical protein
MMRMPSSSLQRQQNDARGLSSPGEINERWAYLVFENFWKMLP